MPTKRTQTLLMLHLAVLLAGWTGVFGRLISLDGLPLVWYRVMVSTPCMVLALIVSRNYHNCLGTLLAERIIDSV